MIKKPCKKYINLTAERLPQVDPIPKYREFEDFSFDNKKVVGILK